MEPPSVAISRPMKSRKSSQSMVMLAKYPKCFGLKTCVPNQNCILLFQNQNCLFLLLLENPKRSY